MLQGQINNGPAAMRYVAGGNATFTLVSPTGCRFTYQARARKGDDRAKLLPGDEYPVWISLLNGPDNTHDYRFLGTAWFSIRSIGPDQLVNYNHSQKSPIGPDAKSAIAAAWFFGSIARGLDPWATGMEFWHEGRCGRCGRKLTVPESVATGFGPECITKIR